LLEDVSLLADELDSRVPWWRTLDETRQGVLLNMAFNMGVPKLMGFKRALSAMKIGDYNRAGSEMLDSQWARQVRGRAAELARQMVLGAWEGAG
jgi:lysozyme